MSYILIRIGQLIFTVSARRPRILLLISLIPLPTRKEDRFVRGFKVFPHLKDSHKAFLFPVSPLAVIRVSTQPPPRFSQFWRHFFNTFSPAIYLKSGDIFYWVPSSISAPSLCWQLTAMGGASTPLPPPDPPVHHGGPHGRRFPLPRQGPDPWPGHDLAFGNTTATGDFGPHPTHMVVHVCRGQREELFECHTV